MNQTIVEEVEVPPVPKASAGYGMRAFAPSLARARITDLEIDQALSRLMLLQLPSLLQLSPQLLRPRKKPNTPEPQGRKLVGAHAGLVGTVVVSHAQSPFSQRTNRVEKSPKRAQLRRRA